MFNVMILRCIVGSLVDFLSEFLHFTNQVLKLSLLRMLPRLEYVALRLLQIIGEHKVLLLDIRRLNLDLFVLNFNLSHFLTLTLLGVNHVFQCLLNVLSRIAQNPGRDGINHLAKLMGFRELGVRNFNPVVVLVDLLDAFAFAALPDQV
jgi:hypothetical protein